MESRAVKPVWCFLWVFQVVKFSCFCCLLCVLFVPIFPWKQALFLYPQVKFPTGLRCAFLLSPVFLETQNGNRIKVSQDLAEEKNIWISFCVCNIKLIVFALFIFVLWCLTSVFDCSTAGSWRKCDHQRTGQPDLTDWVWPGCHSDLRWGTWSANVGRSNHWWEWKLSWIISLAPVCLLLTYSFLTKKYLVLKPVMFNITGTLVLSREPACISTI